MSKAERWQRYYLAHRDELLLKYKARYIRNETKKVDEMISARTGHRATRMKTAGGSGLGHQYDPDENAAEKRARHEQERWRNVTLPPCRFLGRPGPYNWADAIGGQNGRN